MLHQSTSMLGAQSGQASIDCSNVWNRQTDRQTDRQIDRPLETYLIIVSGKVWDEADMFGTDDLNTGLDGHGNLLLHVLTGTCPLGGVIVTKQFPAPPSTQWILITNCPSWGHLECYIIQASHRHLQKQWTLVPMVCWCKYMIKLLQSTFGHCRVTSLRY